MAISVNWATQVITVPKADTTLISAGPPEIREYDIGTTFLAEARAAQESEDGIVFPDIVSHNTSVTVGGVTLARTVE